jgi:hypothetical protein
MNNNISYRIMMASKIKKASQLHQKHGHCFRCWDKKLTVQVEETWISSLIFEDYVWSEGSSILHQTLSLKTTVFLSLNGHDYSYVSIYTKCTLLDHSSKAKLFLLYYCQRIHTCIWLGFLFGMRKNTYIASSKCTLFARKKMRALNLNASLGRRGIQGRFSNMMCVIETGLVFSLP